MNTMSSELVGRC